MFAKVIIVALLAVATANAATYSGAYYKPKQYKQEAPAQHAIDYKVKWEVKDEPSYNYQTRDESKYADKVEGSYSFVEADGTLRIVTYTADENGFVAHVENKPLTFDAPAYNKYEAPQQSQSQYEQSAPQQSQSQYQQSAPQQSQSQYQQSAPQQFQSQYQQSAPQESQSNYGSFQASESAGVTIFSAPPAPAALSDKATLFSAPAKPTFSQSSEVNFRPVARPTLNTFQQQSDSGRRYH